MLRKVEASWNLSLGISWNILEKTVSDGKMNTQPWWSVLAKFSKNGLRFPWSSPPKLS